MAECNSQLVSIVIGIAIGQVVGLAIGSFIYAYWEVHVKKR